MWSRISNEGHVEWSLVIFVTVRPSFKSWDKFLKKMPNPRVAFCHFLQIVTFASQMYSVSFLLAKKDSLLIILSLEKALFWLTRFKLAVLLQNLPARGNPFRISLVLLQTLDTVDVFENMDSNIFTLCDKKFMHKIVCTTVTLRPLWCQYRHHDIYTHENSLKHMVRK